MSVTLNLGAVGIIQPASKPAHILYLKLIFHEFALAELFDCISVSVASESFQYRILFIMPNHSPHVIVII